MRTLSLTLLMIAYIIPSCKKTSNYLPIQDGTYTGTFQRLSTAGGKISKVTIHFSGNNWTGESEIAKYPALCYGSFKLNGSDSIHFGSDCAWTAEFDWSLILSQDYKIKISGNNLEISRNYAGLYQDLYKLTRQ